MKGIIVYRSGMLPLAEMVKNLLVAEGMRATVRTFDPFGAFTHGPHFATFQATPCSEYQVLVSEDQYERAQEFVDGMRDDGGEAGGK
jgi:hypothetical protein